MFDAKAWGDTYRGLLPNHDELLSTSTVREIARGAVDAHPDLFDDQTKGATFDEIIDLASTVRLATVYSGYALSGEVMQHPAPRSEAVFGDPNATASAHSEADLQRRRYVTAHARNVMAVDNLTLDELVTHMARASIEYTLNAFTAPAAASNVQPHTRLANRGRTDRTVQNQMAHREFLKIMHVALGGTLRPASRNETLQLAFRRLWRKQRSTGGKRRRDPSPPRMNKRNVLKNVNHTS